MPNRTHEDDRDLYRELDESIRRNGNTSAALDEFIARHGGNRENLAQYADARAADYDATAPGLRHEGGDTGAAAARRNAGRVDRRHGMSDWAWVLLILILVFGIRIRVTWK